MSLENGSFINTKAAARFLNFREDGKPLSWRALGVGLGLASFMGSDGKCWPSVASLAKRLGRGRKSILLGLRELERRGLIHIKRQTGQASVYSLTSVTSDTGTTSGTGTPRGDKGSPTCDTTPVPLVTPRSNPRSNPRSKKESKAPKKVVPDLVHGLELYEKDTKLCSALPDLLRTWERAYPDVDIPAEIAKAHAWEVANPAKRKKDRPRFLNGWLARAANKRQADVPTDQKAEQREREADAASLAYAAGGFEDRLAEEEKQK